MPEPVEGTRPYLPGLDGVRGVAVLGVVAYHLDLGWASGGLLGVGIFFVLSGYLITDLIAAEYRKANRFDLRGFWLRRARRLLPALFTMLFVVVGWATIFDRAQLSQMRDDLPSAVGYYSNWWFIYDHVSYFSRFGPPSPLGHLWSLAIEEQFYLAWPLLLLCALRFIHSRRLRIGLVLGAAAASAIEMGLLYTPLSDPTRVYDGTDTRAFALLAGAALALAWPRDSKTTPITPGARRILELAGGGSLLGILLLFALTGEYDTFLYRGGMVLCAVLSATLIVVTAHPGARVGRWLGIRPLRWIGKRSYAVYLWSYPVIVLTTPLNKSPGTLRAAIDIGATVILAGLSWKYVEDPIRHGAIARIWHQLKNWSRSRPRFGRRVWTAASLVVANGILCTVGLSGALVAPPLEPTPAVSAIVPGAAIIPAVARRPSDTPSIRMLLDPDATTGPVPAAPVASRPGAGVTAIGDSIMIDAAPYLRKQLPGITIDAIEGQQLYQVLNAVPKLKSEGAIGSRLILELGTNGSYSQTQLTALLRALGPLRKIVIVNAYVPRPWEQQVNATITATVKAFPNATVVNWFAIGPQHPTYFYPDGIHLNPLGAKYYAGLLIAALDKSSGKPATPKPPGAHDAIAPLQVRALPSRRE